MRTRDYLEREELTREQFAELVGVKPETIAKDINRELRPAWIERLGLDPDSLDDDGRAEETTPQAPPGARRATPPPVMDVSTLAGYIEGAYKLGAATLSDSDAALAAAIESYAPAAGEAWAKWVESEPKVKALLERLMVGTPLGEVIAVHVGIAFSYFLARSAESRARRAAEPAAPSEPSPDDDGAGPAASADHLGIFTREA